MVGDGGSRSGHARQRSEAARYARSRALRGERARLLAQPPQAPHRVEVALVDLVDVVGERHLAAVRVDAAVPPRGAGELQLPQQFLAQFGEVPQQVAQPGRGVSALAGQEVRAALGRAARRRGGASPARRAGPRAPSRGGSRRSRRSTTTRAGPSAGGRRRSASSGRSPTRRPTSPATSRSAFMSQRWFEP